MSWEEEGKVDEEVHGEAGGRILGEVNEDGNTGVTQGKMSLSHILNNSAVRKLFPSLPRFFFRDYLIGHLFCDHFWSY